MLNVMAAQPNIGGALCESSLIPFLVPRHKVWLTVSASVPCSNAANIGECKTWKQSEFCTGQNSVRGQEPPEMHIYEPLSDVAVVTKPRRETRLNLLGCSELANRSQPLVG